MSQGRWTTAFRLLSPPQRRPKDADDKPHKCAYTGCNCSYYYLHALRRHEKMKHGEVISRKLASSEGAAFQQFGSSTDHQCMSGSSSGAGAEEHKVLEEGTSSSECEVVVHTTKKDGLDETRPTSGEDDLGWNDDFDQTLDPNETDFHLLQQNNT